MVKTVSGKSQIQPVDVDFAFKAGTFTYHENKWKSYKADIDKFLDEMGHKRVRNPLDPPVDVGWGTSFQTRQIQNCPKLPAVLNASSGYRSTYGLGRKYDRCD